LTGRRSRKRSSTEARGSAASIGDALRAAGLRPGIGAERADKKNFAERFSRHLATHIANALRPDFPGITPDREGGSQEAPARTSKGFKKLDVNYSTPELGLALGVSVKTVNAADPRTGRFTKNYTRIDSELRAEAADYHERQPYAVLAGVLFLPASSCDDARTGVRGANAPSSFGAAVKFFRSRAGREKPTDDIALFERFFVALYFPDMPEEGDARFFDVLRPPPRVRRPRPDEGLSFLEFIAAIRDTYDARNNPPFVWAD
jgi:hypothetical protein